MVSPRFFHSLVSLFVAMTVDVGHLQPRTGRHVATAHDNSPSVECYKTLMESNRNQ